MLVIGLTGGIGSGKSTVAHLFAELGVPIIDTDQLARDVVIPGRPALTAIINRFGSSILNQDGSLNRAELREQIFQFPAHREWLEALLHPLIRQEMAVILKQLNAPYCLVSIPLLFETIPNPLIQHILVVDTPEYLQVSRTKKRDETSQEQIEQILQRQVTRQRRLAGADDAIYNDLDIAHLKQQVQRLHQKFLRLSSPQAQK
jgi:dephospho-CoA kinase